MLTTLKTVASAAIDAKCSELNDIAQKIWENPELGNKEHYAHDLLTSYLEKEGFKVERKTPLETSFIARYGDNTGLKIGVLCEYDALPEIGHACGHNLIAEAGIAAAVGIKAALAYSNEIKAEVVVFGTPDEETNGGKIEMIKRGCFNEVHICMMSHPSPVEHPVASTLSLATLGIIFHGKASHAAAAPWQGINALDAAVGCYNSISMLRQQLKPTSRVHGIIVDGGERPNIIPERSEMQFYIRAVTDEDALATLEKLKEIATGAALATGCTVEFKEDVPLFSSMKTNETLINLYIHNAKHLGVSFNDTLPDLTPGSTDMGNVSKIKPSIHPIFKIKASGANHTRKFTETADIEFT